MAEKGANTLALIGGHLALDFANTAGWHASESRAERLTDYAELVAWAVHAGAITRPAGDALLSAAKAHPRKAAQAWNAAIALREANYRVFAALAQGLVPATADIALLHGAHVTALTTAEPYWDDKSGFAVRWQVDGSDFMSPLHSVMVKVAELLASMDLSLVRQCGRHPCGWLFLDRSRNGSRRWCSSTDCGNAIRVAKFRERREG